MTTAAATYASPTIRHIKDKLDARLNNYLVEMREGHDDSITGFNEAWDVMRAVLSEIGEAVPLRFAGKSRTAFIRLPWRTHLVDSTTVIDADGGDIATIHGDYETEWTVMEARARLIAATPDMLAALKEMHDSACTNATSTPDKAAFLKARAAIAKAEGR